MKKRIPALLLVIVLLMTMVLTGCGQKAPSGPGSDPGSGQTATPDTGDTNAADTNDGEPKQLSVCLGPNPETLDPALNTSVDGANTILFTFDCLLAVDQDNQLIPAQAESYEVSEDNLTYTFHMREGLV